MNSDASLWRNLAIALSALLVALVHATLDAGRAALAIERRRTSAVKAWWFRCLMLARRPLTGFGVYFLISASGLALAGALAIGWMRSARLFAMVQLARSERA